MSTLHKHVADIRELASDELDFVGGASECQMETISYETVYGTDENGNPKSTTYVVDDTWGPDQ